MSDLNAILNNAVAAEDVPFVVKKEKPTWKILCVGFFA